MDVRRARCRSGGATSPRPSSTGRSTRPAGWWGRRAGRSRPPSALRPGSRLAGTTLPRAARAVRAGAAAARRRQDLRRSAATTADGNDGRQVYAYDVGDRTSGSERAPLPEPRFNHAAVALDGKIYVLGGYVERRGAGTTSSSTTRRRDAWIRGTPLPRAEPHLRRRRLRRRDLDDRRPARRRDPPGRLDPRPGDRRWREGPAMPKPMELARRGRRRRRDPRVWESTYQIYDAATGTWRDGPALARSRATASRPSAIGGSLYTIGGCTTELRRQPGGRDAARRVLGRLTSPSDVRRLPFRPLGASQHGAARPGRAMNHQRRADVHKKEDGSCSSRPLVAVLRARGRRLRRRRRQRRRRRRETGGPATQAAAPPRTRAASTHRRWGAEPPSLDPGVWRRTRLVERRCSPSSDPLVRLDREPRARAGRSPRAGTSEDGKTVTFHLREDGKWTNGDPVTAQRLRVLLEADARRRSSPRTTPTSSTASRARSSTTAATRGRLRRARGQGRRQGRGRPRRSRSR